MIDVINRKTRTTAMPRTGRMLDAVLKGGGNKGASGTGGVASPSYWEHVTQNSDGTLLDELAQYIKTKYTAVSEGDVVAYSSGEWNLTSPIATVEAPGMVMIGQGLEIDSNGRVSVTGAGIETGLTDLIVSGTGNAFTSLSLTNGGTVISAVKGSTFALSSDLTSHTGNTTVHVTATERSNWNTAYSNYHTHSNKSYLDTINQSLSTSATPSFSGGLKTGNQSSLWIHHSSGNSIIGMSGSSIGNLYLNYVSSSVNVKIDSAANLMSSGDVVAYSSGTFNLTSPVASASALGMIKVGSGLSISNGVLSATGTGTVSVTWDSILSKPSWIGSSKPSYAWSEITGKPTVISSIGYSTSGSGNVVTNVTASGSTITVTKGTISGGGGSVSWSSILEKPTWVGRMDNTGFQFGEYSGSSPYALLNTGNNPFLHLRSNYTPLKITYNGGYAGNAIEIKNQYGDNATFILGYYRYSSETFGRPCITMTNPVWAHMLTNTNLKSVVWDQNSGKIVVVA
jgi:hypothetical protein